MTTEPIKQEQEKMPPSQPQILGRPDIQTLFIDSFLIHQTADNHIILSGIQSVPGMSMEQLRCIITTAHAEKLAEKLLEIAVPKKEEAKPVPEKVKKTQPAGKQVGSKRKK